MTVAEQGVEQDMSGEQSHEPTVSTSRLPDPGEPLPSVAWPTVALFLAALALFAGSTALAVTGVLPWAVSIVVNSATTYMFFTVLHDASHRTVSSHDRVNEWLGRLSGLFVAPPFASLSVFRYIHMQHHRFTNHDASKDPDAYTTNGSPWTWPLRWATLDLRYYVIYFPLLPSRPRREQVELAATATMSIGAVVALGLAGYLVEALLLYVLPTRFSVMWLGFAFDFLPHHGLDATPKEIASGRRASASGSRGSCRLCSSTRTTTSCITCTRASPSIATSGRGGATRTSTSRMTRRSRRWPVASSRRTSTAGAGA